jgi:hypothetical protein
MKILGFKEHSEVVGDKTPWRFRSLPLLDVLFFSGKSVSVHEMGVLNPPRAIAADRSMQVRVHRSIFSPPIIRIVAHGQSVSSRPLLLLL